MSRSPQLTFGDRAYRREKALAAFARGASSVQVARQFGLSATYVRQCAKAAGIGRGSAAV